MNNQVTVETLLKVFISEVVECIKTPTQVDENSYYNSEPKYFELRVRTQVGGAYWALRGISSQVFKHSDSLEFEKRSQEFFHTHCRNIMDAYEGLNTPEYQD